MGELGEEEAKLVELQDPSSYREAEGMNLPRRRISTGSDMVGIGKMG